ncbi:type 4a pilus biogenesis protein PilO [Actinotalea sp. C106]|uniref:type 4a pilus biogenesis protein PilO n=1 Tax=Actinotalea sp. C106 TaxID=2908644 RepID=UPI002028BF54|nr:type 4a pilus biogenesis protein PilO [Actinotalea sp. C106]
MSTSSARTWVIGTVVLSLLILVGTWFLAVTPKLAETQETRDYIVDEQAREDTLRLQLATLEKQFAEIDTYKAELAGLQAQIPVAAALPGYLRELEEMATTYKVTIVGVSPGPAATLEVPVATPVATAPAETEDTTEPEGEDITADPDAAAAPAEPEPATRLVAIPVSLTVVGTYADVAAFLEGAQEGTDRLLLVTALNTTTQQAAEASGGRPATAAGDLEATIDGNIYVLTDQAAATPSDEPVEGEEPTESPSAELPSSDRNPFAPVAGS